VLEKCGLSVVGREGSPGDGVVEVLLRLDQ
jgi:hypothetical protein